MSILLMLAAMLNEFFVNLMTVEVVPHVEKQAIFSSEHARSSR